jgi:histidyl-tRNA synthetase
MKPSIPKGTRDFLPKQMQGRKYIFNTAEKVFKKFGFLPIETPAVENLATLTGKYGEEGDKLMFKLLHRADKFKKALANSNEESTETNFSELALRYDLTVPFARFVVQNQNDLTFPFRRYQIQPVWRADRPQKGRYREFFQCDVDVVGTNSLLCEVELIQIFNEVLTALKIPGFTIKLNNRKILAGIAEVIGEQDNIINITVAIDKLDKIGIEGVNKELLSKGIAQKAIDQLQPIINLTGSFSEKMEAMKSVLIDSEIGAKGIEELEYINEYCKELSANENLVFDVTLARGLNYYTGAIFEVSCEGFKGSICGGGRYDNLTELFGLKNISGVGVSFGADRIYDVLLDNNLFPKEELDSLEVLIVNFGTVEERYSMKVLKTLRDGGINSELYPTSAKLKKQMSYAHDKGAKFALMIGEDEIASGELTCKNMETGEQQKLTVAAILDMLKA